MFKVEVWNTRAYPPRRGGPNADTGANRAEGAELMLES
jgi:hypothetical protein